MLAPSPDDPARAWGKILTRNSSHSVRPPSEMPSKMSAHPRSAADASAGSADLRETNRRLKAEVDGQKVAAIEQERIRQALVSTQELELGRISRELHDGIGQHVTALLLGLKRLEESVVDRPAARTVLDSLKQIAERIGRDIHGIAVELRPTSLSDLGLVRCLENFINDRMARAKITVDFDHEEFGPDRLPEHLETTLYRVLYEAMNNVFRHAQARRAGVILRKGGDTVVGIVEDDGVGFDLTALDKRRPRVHLGLIGMRERVALVGGELTIESRPGHGTTVIVRLPLIPDSHVTLPT